VSVLKLLALNTVKKSIFKAGSNRSLTLLSAAVFLCGHNDKLYRY
jgi:hypothetical protein